MYFNETRIANLERNHVVFVAILFSCQGTDVRERAAILPDPHVRVKRVGSTSVNPTRLMRTRSPLSKYCLEKIGGMMMLLLLAGTGDSRSSPPACQLQRVVFSTP